MTKDLLWLVVMAVLLCGGGTHTAGFRAGMWGAGFWGGFWRGLVVSAEREAKR